MLDDMLFIMESIEFRKDMEFFHQDGAEAVQLGFFLSIYEDPVTFVQPVTDIGYKEFKVFVEYGLGSYAEFYRLDVFF